jgi:hypothetical protein
MYSYRFGEKMTKEALDKLIAQVPSQAGAILLATWEIGTNQAVVTEDQIMDLIESDLARFSPRAKDKSVIPGFVAYYRMMLGKLPAHILVQTKDASGGKARGGSRASRAENITDPITGELMANVFKRAPVKNPGSKKTRKIVTEELLSDEDDGYEEPVDELEEEVTES